MDETYQAYLNRVAKLTRLDTYHTQLQNIQPSPKFNAGEAVPFPGYTVNSPTWETDSQNGEFYQHLTELQNQLTQWDSLIISVPTSSFHLTIADLIWNDAYQDAVAEDPQFEEKLCDRIGSSFQHYSQSRSEHHPVQLQVIGFMIRPRAISVGLLPKDEESYQKLLQLRRTIYQNSNVIALGVEQHYPYTAHITLGYFQDIPEDFDREKFGGLLDQLNDQTLNMDPPLLTIEQAQLQKFTDMTKFYRESHFPKVKL